MQSTSHLYCVLKAREGLPTLALRWRLQLQPWVFLLQHAGLNPMAGEPKAGCPTGNIQQTLDKLTVRCCSLFIRVVDRLAILAPMC